MQDLEAWEIAVRRSLINHADLCCLNWYRRELLTNRQRDLLEVVYSRIERFPDYFDREGQRYDQTAGLVLMSSWERAVDFCTCMDEEARKRWRVMGKKRPVLNCRYWRLCDHCAWRRKMDLQCRFLNAFDQGKWNFLTISFVGSLAMAPGYLNSGGQPVTHADLVTYWDAARDAVKQLIADGVILGAVLVEEIHLESLYPVPLILPHTHVLVLAGQPLVQRHIDQMKALMLQFNGQVINLVSDGHDDARWCEYHAKLGLFEEGIRKTKPRKPPMVMESDPRLKVELPISIDLKPLPEQRDFSNCLGYLVKPVKLASVYRHTRNVLIRENPGALEFLAQNVNDFLVGSDLLLTPRRTPAYFGVCDARRTEYCGAAGTLLEDDGWRAETKSTLKKLRDDAKSHDVGPLVSA